ncbi:hypothetical protein DV096_20090 [Bradymonadaceae bacterium TMQ3]|uniref:DNA-binding protein n=1 Tax=Lujinxingia sediminis TaxID=2480984 RepID=A0ABY0CN31_9DELT|nr:hypothetical protein [Lujinxingia sediminis]RDV36223.1 hypothetical protein DV096_20090 [Bradymonadaceae bacterium TMQ3]RVU40967.1 hypothetical protein EA187_19490 [Lujinxingia sediminis]TXC67624.1 hypothetical protein FRC91_20075 [Bradymonadales bacterium TMQ1]
MADHNPQRLDAISDALLRSRGIDLSSEELLRRKGIDMSVAEIFELVLRQVAELPDVSERDAFEMPDRETRTRLRALGITFEPFEGEDDPVASSIAAYSDVLAASLTTTEAAHIIGVNASRVRQLLTASPARLYGIKSDARASWRIPRFQFDAGGVIRGLDQVLEVLDPTLHPMEVITWFESPCPDLVVGEDVPVSPIQWLRAGNAIDEVVAIARHLS